MPESTGLVPFALVNRICADPMGATSKETVHVCVPTFNLLEPSVGTFDLGRPAVGTVVLGSLEQTVDGK